MERKRIFTAYDNGADGNGSVAFDLKSFALDFASELT